MNKPTPVNPQILRMAHRCLVHSTDKSTLPTAKPASVPRDVKAMLRRFDRAE